MSAQCGRMYYIKWGYEIFLAQCTAVNPNPVFQIRSNCMRNGYFLHGEWRVVAGIDPLPIETKKTLWQRIKNAFGY